LRRAYQRLPGTTFALFPGETYVQSNPTCVSLRWLLGVPTDGVLEALLVLDNGEPLGQFRTFARDRCNIEVVPHVGTQGWNTEKQRAIKWYSFGTPNARTPADALSANISVSEADLAFVAGQPQMTTVVERGHRDCPMSLTLQLLERDGEGRLVRRKLKEDENLSDDEMHGLGWLYQQHRETNRDVVTLEIPAKFLGGLRPRRSLRAYGHRVRVGRSPQVVQPTRNSSSRTRDVVRAARPSAAPPE